MSRQITCSFYCRKSFQNGDKQVACQKTLFYYYHHSVGNKNQRSNGSRAKEKIMATTQYSSRMIIRIYRYLKDFLEICKFYFEPWFARFLNKARKIIRAQIFLFVYTIITLDVEGVRYFLFSDMSQPFVTNIVWAKGCTFQNHCNNAMI